MMQSDRNNHSIDFSNDEILFRKHPTLTMNNISQKSNRTPLLGKRKYRQMLSSLTP